MTSRVFGDPVRVAEWYKESQKAAEREAVRVSLADLGRLREALAANRQWLDRPSAPTNAQTLAHLDRLTRQVSSLLRLVGADLHAELLEMED